MTPGNRKRASAALQAVVRAMFWVTVTTAALLTVSFAGIGN